MGNYPQKKGGERIKDSMRRKYRDILGAEKFSLREIWKWFRTKYIYAPGY
jgi:hypothetical protein